jgi:hypothetical protein
MSDAITAAIETSIANFGGESGDGDTGGHGGDGGTGSGALGTGAGADTGGEASAGGDGTGINEGATSTEIHPENDPHGADEDGQRRDQQGQPKDQAGAPKKKGGVLPLHRHETILANARAEADRRVETVKQEYEARLGLHQTQLQALEVADKDPKRFLEALVEADPRYAELIGPAVRGGSGRGSAPTIDPGAEMPQPDVQQPDGSFAYSQAGLQKLLQWQAAQTESRLAERYKPIEETFRAEQAVRTALPRVRQRIADAEQWPGFADGQNDIASAMLADKRLSLEGAYIKVVIPRLQQSRDTMRAEILAELNQRPKAVTGTAPSAAPSSTPTGPRDLEDVIRDAIRGKV